MPKKGVGLGQFADLKEGGLGKMEEGGVGGIFEGGRSDTPMHTINLAITLTVILIY